MTDPSDNVAWLWYSDPFGVGATPHGIGFTYNGRLPGQYYDEEKGFHYNGMRDYDPQTGRYLQSDPIGVGGGVNTYAYVVDNPITRMDPLGLVPPYSAPLPPGLTDQDVNVQALCNAYNQSQTWASATTQWAHSMWDRM